MHQKRASLNNGRPYRKAEGHRLFPSEPKLLGFLDRFGIGGTIAQGTQNKSLGSSPYPIPVVSVSVPPAFLYGQADGIDIVSALCGIAHPESSSPVHNHRGGIGPLASVIRAFIADVENGVFGLCPGEAVQ